MSQETLNPAETTGETWLRELRSPRTQSGALENLGDFLRRTLARVLRDRAGVQDTDLEDFTQDALVRVLEGLDGFRGDSRFTTWATAVAVRVAFGALRRRRYREGSLEDLELGDAETAAGSPPGAALDRESLLGALQHAIGAALTARQRTAVLGELAGVPTSVLVERLQTNPGALYKLHHDARKKLKRALEDAGYREEDVRSELLEAPETS